MSRVLVTGGSGFIGTNVVASLLDSGQEVVSIDIEPPRCAAHAEVFRRVDILDAEALGGLVREFAPERIVHLAARIEVLEGHSLEFYRANTDGVTNLVNAISACQAVERCLFASTKLVVPGGYVQRHVEDYRPDTLYGRSKVIGEQIVRRAGAEMGCTWCIVRPTSIWGEWFDLGYREFFQRVDRGRFFHIGRTDPPRSFGYVGNTVFQIDRLLAAPADRVDGGTFYLSDYDVYTTRQWANLIARELGRREPRTMPDWVLNVAARVGDVLRALGWTYVPISTFRLRNLRTDTTHIDLEPMREISGPLPYDLETGVRRTLAWMADQGLLRSAPAL